MTALETSVDVDVPPEDVYRFIADGYAENHPRWDAGIVAVELEDLVQAGARGSESRRFLGRASTTHFEVVAAERPSRLVLRNDPAVWALTRTHRIVTLEPARTRLSLTFDMQPHALWFRLVYPLVRPMLRRQVRATVRKLGNVLEQSSH